MIQYLKLFKLLIKNIIYSRVSIAIIFVSSIAVSLVVWTYSKEYYENIAQKHFESTITKSLQGIQERINSYENILRSGVGFLYASDKINPQKWHDFITALDVKINYPGMQGIGFSQILDSNALANTTQKESREYSSILFIEPMNSRNMEAIGYDMFKDSKRREAMIYARDTGLAAITKKLTLIQEIDFNVQAGILMYLPVYKKDAKIDSLNKRKEALRGFVYSPFRMNDLINNIHLEKLITSFKIYDSEDMGNKNLLYSSTTTDSSVAQYNAFKKIEIMNRRWYIEFKSTPAFDASTKTPYPLYMTLGGLIANFFLLFIVLTLVKSLQRLERQVKKNREQTLYMLHQSRLAQMGEIISMIAHQWRQPLSSISAISGAMTVDVVMDNYDKTFFSEQLELIDKLSQHLSSTIDDFREFFKDNKIKKEATVKEIVEGTLQIISSSFESKNIELIFEQEDKIKIYTYVNELKQVIANILKNAEDALIENRDSNFKIWISWHVQNEYLYIDIEDNAGGVPQEILETVFEPYFTTKDAKNGTGLGLYMSKIIVEEHCGGSLSVINTQRGAKFTVVLPLVYKKSDES